MNLSSLTNLDVDTVLDALGLQTRRSAGSRTLETLGLVGLGALLGACAALLLAPKPGAELREELKENIRQRTNGSGLPEESEFEQRRL